MPCRRAISPDGIHLAAHARVMHWHHRPGAGRDQAFQLPFVQIQCVGPDVGKDDFRAAQGKRVGRGHEGERRHDDFIAGLDVQQQGAHFERVGAGGGDHGLGHAERLFEKRLALPRVGLVPRDLPDGHRAEYVFQFPALER